ncbi:MAG: radical SAM family heme chaperone HemW, partial [Akkermansiaceae bacterium]|nr:radical SAM family heme chaperone HemW [Akkermansiaceae bacterium]
KHTPGATPVGAVVDALVGEARQRLGGGAERPRTLYLGGGTPGMLSPGHLRRLFDGLREVIDFSTLEEVTLEANPATFDVGKARLFGECGVTRVSLGIQSFAPHVLAVLGREHSPEQAREAVPMLREAGIREVNIDLMFSIPGQTEQDWRATLEQAVALEPDHISAYNLTYEEDTAFFDSLRRGEMRVNEDDDAVMFTLADACLTGAGFDHYETSNYARPGCHSSHNRGYWRGEDYLGLGPSAVSTQGGVREVNVADTARYVAMVNSLGRAVVESETLTPEAIRIERIALGLRTTDGIGLDWLDPQGVARAGHLAAAGLARVDGGRLVLVRHGRALVDPIAAELI